MNRYYSILKAFVVFFFCSYSFVLHAQELYKLSGTISDDNGNPLVCASVFVRGGDSSLNDGTVTNEVGSFSFDKLLPGKYFVEASFLGYTSFTDTLEVVNKDIQLEIKLQEDAQMLETVTVLGIRKNLKRNLSKTTLTVENSMLSKLPNAEMLLSFIPGLIVNSGNLEVVGKGRPLIIIDGKELNDNSILESLPPETIKRVTVDRNPSAKYASQFRAVLIVETISTRKPQLSGQLSHSSVFKNRYNHTERANIIFSDNKWSALLSYTFKGNPLYEGVETATNIFKNKRNEEATYIYDSNMLDKQSLQNIMFESTYKPCKKHSLSAYYMGTWQKGNNDITGTEKEIALNNSAFTVLRTGKEYSNQHAYGITYLCQINNNSRLNLFADRLEVKKRDNENAYINVSNSNIGNRFELNNSSHLSTTMMKAEYSLSYSTDANFLLGSQYSSVSHLTDISALPFYGFKAVPSVHEMHERTISFYSTISKKVGGLLLEGGLRYEHLFSNYSKSYGTVSGLKISQSYILPSFSLSYHTDKDSQFGISYSSKLKRPQFADLDPSIRYLSSKFYECGEVALLSEKYHNFEFNAIFPNHLSLKLGYSYIKDPITYTQSRMADNDSLLLNKPTNLSQASELSFGLQYDIFKGGWNATIMGDVSIPFVDVKKITALNKLNYPLYQLVLTNTFMVTPTIFLVGNFVAQSKYSYLNNVIDPSFRLTLALNMVLLDGLMTVTLAGNNLLNKADPSVMSYWNNIVTAQHFRPDSREVGINIKINLNGYKWKSPKKVDNTLETLERLNK